MTRLGLNLLAYEPSARDPEVTQTLVTGKGVRVEGIVSHGQASPDGFWYDQAEAEWVTVLAGNELMYCSFLRCSALRIAVSLFRKLRMEPRVILGTIQHHCDRFARGRQAERKNG